MSGATDGPVCTDCGARLAGAFCAATTAFGAVWRAALVGALYLVLLGIALSVLITRTVLSLAPAP